MNIQKIKTAKNNLEAVRLFDDENRTIKFVVRQQSGHFGFYDECNYVVTEDPTGIEEFLSAYEIFLAKQESKRLEKFTRKAKETEVKRLSEEKRIADLISVFKEFKEPYQLCEYLNLDLVITAKHWNELYNGKAGYGVKICSKAEYEDFKLAVETLGIEGKFGELCHVVGEHHWTFSWNHGLEDYQVSCKKYFSGTNYFYHSQDESHDFYMERIKNAESINDVKDIIKEYDELEACYCDCNGNLIILESDLENEDFTGYGFDNKISQFGFKFNFKYKFNDNEETEEEE